MKTYLVIETTNINGKVAYVETVNETINLAHYNKYISVSAYPIKHKAEDRVKFLNNLYKEQKQ